MSVLHTMCVSRRIRVICFFQIDAKDDGCNVLRLRSIALGIYAADVVRLRFLYLPRPG